MTKKETIASACLYIWCKRNGYTDLFYEPYMPQEVRKILYKNRRRWTKFFKQHTQKQN